MFWFIVIAAVVAFFIYAHKKGKKEKLLKEAEEKYLQDFQDSFNSGNYKKILEITEGKPLDNSHKLMAVAVAHLNLGNEAKGLEFFEKSAFKESSSHYSQSKIYINLGKTYYNLGQYEKAIKVLQGLDPEWVKDEIKYGNYKVPQLIGDSFFNLKMYDAAMNAYKKAPLGKKEITSDLNQMIFNIGECYEELGNKRMALKQYQKVQANDIMFVGINEKLRKLEGNLT